MANARTKIVLLVLTAFLTRTLCESDVLKNYSVDKDIEKADLLLRGSEEDKEGEERVNEEVVLENQSIDKEEEATTTEIATTTDIPDVNLKNGVKSVDKDDIKDETVSVDVTESTTDGLDNSVIRTTAAEDIYNASNVVKTETPSPPTTRSMDMDGMAPRIAELDDEPETTGERSPKTKNAEPKIPERPTYEPTPPPAAVSALATLRSWLEDGWLRAPAGVLVPLRSSALARAQTVWDELVESGLDLADIVLVGYDSHGINWRSRHNLQGTSTKNGNKAVSDALSKLLLKYQGVHDANDGTMRALTSATKLVPYDSALFLLTDKGAGDLHRLPLALRALVEKRLKVYTIWTNPNVMSAESEMALQGLRNISRHTEGEVLLYNLQNMGMDAASNLATEMESWDPKYGSQRQARLNSMDEEEKFETLLVRRGSGAISLGIPVEYGATALRIIIEGAVEHAVLYPPNDAPQVDLYNITSVRAFSPASRTNRLSPLEVLLVFPGADPEDDMLAVLPMRPTDSVGPMAGMWHLSVRCDTCDYRLSVSARAQLRFHAYPQQTDALKIRVMGPVASVRESALIDEYGAELAKLPFSYQPIAGDGPDSSQDSPIAELEAEIPIPDVKAPVVYAKILGRDIRGEPFVRLSGPINKQPEIRMGRSATPDLNDLERAEDANTKAYAQAQLQYNDSNVLPFNRAVSQVVNQRGTILTAVQIGLSTRLYGAPGDNLQLHFEVTNYREQSVRFAFEAIGELRFLRGINPTSQTIAAGQTANVIVNVGITTSAQPGARDLITFTAYGLDQVSISAYVYVVNTIDSRDVWSPDVRHNFQGMCIGKLGTDCAQHVWSASIYARDATTGLLRLTSSPIGLIYDSNFISGTREEVMATYRATCCAPRLSITAVDANGNVNSYVIDISGYLNGASVAAITLAVFLGIAVLAVIIFLVVWCVRRRKESRTLPYTTSTRNIS